MKYSWQNKQAPFLRPSIVEALIISSISGTSLFSGCLVSFSLLLFTIELLSSMIVGAEG